MDKTNFVGKKAFNLEEALEKIGKEVSIYPKAAMFELSEKGFDSTFEQLIACMISIRTRDEVTLKVAYNLFKKVRTPEEFIKLGQVELDKLIQGSTYHEQKSYRMIEISEIIINQHQGQLPCSQEVLLSLPGIGPKCANLVLGVACNQPFISVDIHVHRVTNRWGYINQKTPEATLKELEKKVPEKLWIDINRVLMPFGKHICTGTLPKCSTCPVLDMCEQVGVTEHR